jgi:SAM-dependent methyltransferase
MKESMTWSAGYPTEIEYTYGYYRELCPTYLRLACLSAGIATAKADPLKYLELGFGQGVSINIHAAGNEGDFWGTDFNPSQAAHARELAEASGSSATLLDASFAELAARPDLPHFDIIGLHGIWTWISEENSRVVVDIIRRKLKVGGLVYVSYNCLPAWAPAMPLRHLMKLHANLAAEAAGVVAKVDGAVAFAQQVIDSGALYFRANPAVGERLKALSGLRRNYLVHEYFTEDWRPITFSDMSRVLEDAKLDFVGSANLLDHCGGGQSVRSGAKVAIGHQPPDPPAVRPRLSGQSTVQTRYFREGVAPPLCARAGGSLPPTTACTPDGPERHSHEGCRVSRRGDIGRVILPAFDRELRERGFCAKDPRASCCATSQAGLPAVHEPDPGGACAHGSRSPAQVPSRKAQARSPALNRRLCERARGSDTFTFLASPVTGGGVPVNRQQQLFLLAAHNGKRTPSEQAKFVWDTLEAQGHRVIKEGKMLETPDENLAELSREAEAFAEKRAPILKALGVAL